MDVNCENGDIEPYPIRKLELKDQESFLALEVAVVFLVTKFREQE